MPAVTGGAVLHQVLWRLIRCARRSLQIRNGSYHASLAAGCTRPVAQGPCDLGHLRVELGSWSVETELLRDDVWQQLAQCLAHLHVGHADTLIHAANAPTRLARGAPSGEKSEPVGLQLW